MLKFFHFSIVCDSSSALDYAAVLQSTTYKANLYTFLLSIFVIMLIPWIFRNPSRSAGEKIFPLIMETT